jgi:hypothetical protein
MRQAAAPGVRERGKLSILLRVRWCQQTLHHGRRKAQCVFNGKGAGIVYDGHGAGYQHPVRSTSDN